MQHYGAPTRLLDWTDSPLVALFFALHKHGGGRDPVVWVLDPWWLNKKLRKGVDGPLEADWIEASAYLHELEDAFTYQNPVEVQGPAAIEPPHVDRRVSAQKSRFVIFGKTKDLSKTRAAKESQSKCRLAKIAISQDSIGPMSEELENAGLSVSFIFPDLEGLCAKLCDRWSLAKKKPNSAKPVAG
jgi:hypothetical protein